VEPYFHSITGLNEPICSGMSHASLSGTSSTGRSSGGLQKSTVPVSSVVVEEEVVLLSLVAAVVSPVSPVPVRESGPVVGVGVVVDVDVVVPEADNDSVPSSASVASPVRPEVGVVGTLALGSV
jgi:hypothetical protein